jgi:hypothetical protein
MSLMQRVYGDRPALEVKENKANSSPNKAKKSKSRTPASSTEVRKGKKGAKVAVGKGKIAS